MTNETGKRWPFRITSYAPSHRQFRLDEALTREQITAATGVEPIVRPDGDKVSMQWTFYAEWTYSIPNGTLGGFATHCKIWDYDGARWSAFGPPEVFRHIGLEPLLVKDYGDWQYDEDGNQLVALVDEAVAARHRTADTARIAELEREVARLREAHIGSHSFTSAGGDCAPFVTMNFKSKDARDQFVSAHLDVIQAHHRATTALGGQP